MSKSRIIGLCLLMLSCCLAIQAQRVIIFHDGYIPSLKRTEVTGHVQMKENETQRMAPLQNAGVRVFCLTDSTYHQSRVTDKDGNFTLMAFLDRDKDYEIQVSYLGTDTYTHKIPHANILKLDTITLHEKPITMEEAVIVAKLKKMRILGDTTIFNTDAFRVSEGAVLLELVRKMPGLRISEGKMTYQGKDINEILLNGEKFFSNDISVALQNMPVNLLKEVRIYDKKSEESELTGVDDGQRTTVMDLKTKQDVNNALMANTSAGVGNHDLYGLNGMLNYFETGGNHATAFANQHNTPNDIGMDAMAGSMFSGGFYGGGGNPMKQLSRRFGSSVSRKIKDLNVGGDISYNDNGADTKNYTTTENYLPSGNTYSDQSSLSSSDNRNLSASVNLTGDLSERFSVMGNFSFGKYWNNNWNENRQATFNTNPYDYTSDPLGQGDAIPTSSRVNSTDQQTLSHSNSENMMGMLMLSYKFKKERRGLTLQLSGNKNDNDSKRFNESQTRYYQLGDSLLHQNRFTLAPTRSRQYSAGLSYNEPLGKDVTLRLSYTFHQNNNKENENIFDIGRLTASQPDFTFGQVPEGYEDTRIDSLSNINNSREQQHEIQLGADFTIKKDWHLNASFSIQPEQQSIYMLREEQETDTTLSRVNYNARLMLFYFKNKTSLNVSYMGSSNSPSISQLLPMTNNDNPLYITLGNPNLKPSFMQNVNVNFRHDRLWSNVSYSHTFNNITYRTDYDPVSGVSTNRPENINGNWSTHFDVGYSKDWETFSLESETNYGYSNQANYINVDSRTNKDAIRNHDFSQLVKGVYTPSWAEFILSAQVQLNKTKSKLQKASDSFNQTYTFLGETHFYLPWNIRLSSTFSCITRRGFLSDEMNRSELLWNASASYSFLKKKQASVKLEVYDILQRSTNFSAYTSSTASVQSRSEGVNSYFLLSFNYRFNLFKGKKEADEE